MHEDKRKSERSPIELAASFGIDASSEKMNEAQIKNVSEGGVCFISSDELKSGTEILLNVDTGSGEIIPLLVTAAWSSSLGSSNKHMTGVRILDTSTPDYQKFVKFYIDLKSS